MPDSKSSSTGHEDSTAVRASLPRGLSLRETLQAVRHNLAVQPSLDALATAQVALFPLLQGGGHALHDPRVFRHQELPSQDYISYQLYIENTPVRVDVWSVRQSLARFPAKDRLPQGEAIGLRCNGAEWHIFDFRQATLPLKLNVYDEDFLQVFQRLFSLRSSETLLQRLEAASQLFKLSRFSQALERLSLRLGAATLRKQSGGNPEQLIALLEHYGLLRPEDGIDAKLEGLRKASERILQATQYGFIRPAPPFTDIRLEDVQRHCQVVKGFKGQLEAKFDRHAVDIHSRSGFYYVLAALALQYGREDAIPAEDLVYPPEDVPEHGRYRPLGRPGWYLSLEGNSEDAVRYLLEVLNLRQRFSAVQRGEPFPSR